MSDTPDLDEQHFTHCDRPDCPRCAHIRSQHDQQHNQWKRQPRRWWR